MYKEKIVNVLTGEISWRDFTAEEIEQQKLGEAEAALRVAELEAKEAARQAVLTKLGLTAEEAQALFG